MCPIQFRQDGPPFGPPAFMPFEQFTGYVDSLPELEELHLQGMGEPLMHPRFFEMVEYAAGRGVRVSTNSNLTLLNAERAERLVSCGLGRIHVSIDGSTRETYERIRVRASYARVIGNLERLLETRARLGSARPEIELVLVLMRQNLAELPGLVRQAHAWGIERLSVQHLCHDFGESSLPAHYRPMREFVDQETLLREDPARVKRYFAEARAAAQETGIDLRLPRTVPRQHPPGTPGPMRCDWPWRGAYLSYQGLAMPCCMVATPDRINFGSVAEDGFEAVWGNADYVNFREQLASDTPPEVCSSCAVYKGIF
jgi:MoaA/NifB/PqqE/SkfB family radical SAM enzyme